MGEKLKIDKNRGYPPYYRLPTTNKLNKVKIDHEFLQAQLYVALQVTGYLDAWIVEEVENEFGLLSDADSVFHNNIIFWEIDRGTEPYSVIKSKIDRYIQMSRQKAKDAPGTRFNVCFTTVDEYDQYGFLKRTASKRAEGILSLLSEVKRGDQFLVAEHDLVLQYPTEKVFSSPENVLDVSLLDL